MEFVFANWEYFLAGFYIAEKVVKITPMKWDDILVDGLKAGFNKVFGGGLR